MADDRTADSDPSAEYISPDRVRLALPQSNLVRRPTIPRHAPDSPLWPTDDRIYVALVQEQGVLGLAATVLWVDESALSQWIVEHPALAEDHRRLQEVADWSMTKHVRTGCVAGDHGAMWLRQAQLKQGAAGHAGTDAGPRPVDYLREVESAADCTDADLSALIRRDAIGRRPGPQDVCPMCGRAGRQQEPAGNGGPSEAVVPQ